MNKHHQQQINDSINQHTAQNVAGRLGVIMSYDKYTHTATVAITKEQTDEIDEVITKVMCPVTLGVQAVAPEPGRPCWVVFKDNNITQGLITHFFNHRYSTYDYPKQSKTHVTVPSYLLGS
jgi:hypothetical protein